MTIKAGRLEMAARLRDRMEHMMQLKALVPHDVNFYRECDTFRDFVDGRLVIIASPDALPYMTVQRDQTPLRLVSAKSQEDLPPRVDVGVPTRYWGQQELNYIPPTDAGVRYIVSLAVVPYLPNRHGTFFIVDKPVVDTSGKPVGCIGLSQIVM